MLGCIIYYTVFSIIIKRRTTTNQLKDMKKGTKVFHMAAEIYGKTIEEVCPSPTERNPNRMVVRVKWADKSESIENIEDLMITL